MQYPKKTYIWIAAVTTGLMILFAFLLMYFSNQATMYRMAFDKQIEVTELTVDALEYAMDRNYNGVDRKAREAATVQQEVQEIIR